MSFQPNYHPPLDRGMYMHQTQMNCTETSWEAWKTFAATLTHCCCTKTNSPDTTQLSASRATSPIWHVLPSSKTFQRFPFFPQNLDYHISLVQTNEPNQNWFQFYRIPKFFKTPNKRKPQDLNYVIWTFTNFLNFQVYQCNISVIWEILKILGFQFISKLLWHQSKNGKIFCWL